MSILVKQAIAHAFSELVMHVESALWRFKLAELRAAYENCLKNLNIDSSANRTRFKGELLEDNGI